MNRKYSENISKIFKRVPFLELQLKFLFHQNCLLKSLGKDSRFFYINVNQTLQFQGAWGTYRHLLIDEPESVSCPHAYVNVTTTGDLSSLRWLQGPFKPDQSFKQNNVKLLQVFILPTLLYST